MFGEQNKLKELFDKYGWKLVDSQSPSAWWIVEIWLIKSIWSPTDCKVFLSFIVDEQWTDRSRAAVGVNRITATVDKPIDWLAKSEFEFNKIEMDTDNVAGLYLGRSWERNVSEFFEELADFRSKYNNLKN
jgi:hypothetical protein